ncbi:MAG: hypothetical protein ACK4KT_02870 [Thermaurantimonas sp.]
MKETYHPFFLSTNDEFWRNILLDSVHTKLFMHVKENFEDISHEVAATKQIFEQYNIQFDPDFRRVFMYTYVSNLDYNYPVIFRDTLLFVALDLYLGEDFPAYNYLPRYLARERSRKYIPIDIALAVSEELTYRSALNSETLLSYMIREGIKLYTACRLLPKEKEYDIIKYTKEQWDFCVKNERNIWLYFIQNKLLYDSNIMTIKKFIDPAPFTKMGTDFDREIPGRIGRWVGYRIVCEFMKKNADISPKQLTEITDYQNLFSKSNYKP